MYDYDLLKNELKEHYKHDVRYVIPISLPKITFKDENIQVMLERYINGIELTYFIYILCKPKRVGIDFIINDIKNKISLWNDDYVNSNLDIITESINIFINSLLDIVNELNKYYDLKNVFNVNQCSFDMIIDDRGYLENISEIIFINNNYLIMDSYYLK